MPLFSFKRTRQRLDALFQAYGLRDGRLAATRLDKASPPGVRCFNSGLMLFRPGDDDFAKYEDAALRLHEFKAAGAKLCHGIAARAGTPTLRDARVLARGAAGPV